MCGLPLNTFSYPFEHICGLKVKGPVPLRAFATPSTFLPSSQYYYCADKHADISLVYYLYMSTGCIFSHPTTALRQTHYTCDERCTGCSTHSHMRILSSLGFVSPTYSSYFLT